jgi:hypothetical protein
MQRFLVLPLSILLVCLTGGCSSSAGNKSAKADKTGSTTLTAKGIEVTIEGGGQFPKPFAGRWTGPELWEFNFEPNGVISSMIHTLGGVEMKPWYIVRVPVLGGNEAVFRPGLWFVHYTPSTRILTVKITVEDFNFPAGEGTLTGNCVDIFTGPVSEDGTVWNVTWTNFPDYTGHTKELPNYKLPVLDPNGEVREVVFEKATGSRMITIE